MTLADKIAYVRSIGDISADIASDTVVTQFLGNAGRAILNRMYPYGAPSDVTDVPTRYETLQCEIAVYLIQKRGAEGESAHNENGINRTYGSATIPSGLLKEVIPHVGVFAPAPAPEPEPEPDDGDGEDDGEEDDNNDENP